MCIYCSSTRIEIVANSTRLPVEALRNMSPNVEVSIFTYSVKFSLIDRNLWLYLLRK